MNLKINKISEPYREIIQGIVRSIWCDDTIGVHDQVFNTTFLDGLKVVNEKGEIVGILHDRTFGNECEILTLASLEPRKGTGTTLLTELEQMAREHNCLKLTVTATNDNLHALGFYQKHGFHITDGFPGQVNRSRHLKPSIPLIGDNGIPIRDELRLEKSLI